MKFRILLAFAAFAFLAQAEAKTEKVGLPEIHDRGIIDYLKAKLAAAKEKLEEMLDKALDALKEKIDATKESVERVIKQLKRKADQIDGKVLELTNKILDELEAAVAEIILQKSHSAEDISECMIMKDNFRQAVLSVAADSRSCIDNKIKEAYLHALDIYRFTIEATAAIKRVKIESIECIRDVKGIKEIAAAIRCVGKVSAKGTVVVGKTVPTVMLKVAKLMKELATLPVSLSLCMPTKALINLGEQVEPVVESIKDCIQEKIEESKAPKKSTEEVFQREHTIEEQSDNEIPKKEHPEVQSDFGYEAPAESGPITVQM